MVPFGPPTGKRSGNWKIQNGNRLGKTHLARFILKMYYNPQHNPKVTVLFAPVPFRTSITFDTLMYSYNFHITILLEARCPLLTLIICCYGGWSCPSSSRPRRWGRPGWNSSPTVAGFSLQCFAPAFLYICYHSFPQCPYVSLVFLRCNLVSRYFLHLLVDFDPKLHIDPVLRTSHPVPLPLPGLEFDIHCQTGNIRDIHRLEHHIKAFPN